MSHSRVLSQSEDGISQLVSPPSSCGQPHKVALKTVEVTRADKLVTDVCRLAVRYGFILRTALLGHVRWSRKMTGYHVYCASLQVADAGSLHM